MINVEKLAEYWKGIIAFAAGMALVVQSLLEAMVETGGEITASNVVTWVIALAGALAVVLKANRAPVPDAQVDVEEQDDLAGEG